MKFCIFFHVQTDLNLKNFEKSKKRESHLWNLFESRDYFSKHCYVGLWKRRFQIIRAKKSQKQLSMSLDFYYSRLFFEKNEIGHNQIPHKNF